MRKKILIIAAVGGLDLAYIFLMGGGLEVTEIAQLDEPAAAAPAQPYFVLKPEVSDPVEREPTIEEAEIAVRNITRTIERPRFEAIPVVGNSRKEKTVRQSAFSASSYEKDVKLTDTVIWVNTPVSLQSRPNESFQVMRADETDDLAQREENKKRSFGSIIKKPYHWIKALASKLK